MKNINFIKTGMENFCCYTELMEYEFKNNKVVLITGPNGVGKSTLSDSVLFSFFGETSKGAKSTDVVNNVVGKNCHTYVEFTSEADGVLDNYRIDRYVKHSKLSDTVLLFKNDMTKAYKKGQKEVLPEIEKILVPQKLFTNTLLFGQKVKDFFTDLPDSDRKDIFRKVLQLDNYVLYQDETSKRIKQVNLDLEGINTKFNLNVKFLSDVIDRINLTNEDIKNFDLRKKEEIDGLTQKINQLNTNLLKLNEKEKSLDNINELELRRLNEEISTIQNEINKLDMELKNSLDSLDNTKKLKESEFNSKSQEVLSDLKLNKTNTISGLNQDFQEYKSEMQVCRNTFTNNKNNYRTKYINNKKEIEKNIPEILKLESSLNKSDATCPTCGKLLTEEAIKQELTNSLNNLQKLNKEMLDENDNLKKLIDESIDGEKRIDESTEFSKLTLDKTINKIENDDQLKVNEINQRLIEAKNKINAIVINKKTIIENEYLDKKKILSNKLNISKSMLNILVKSLEEKALLIENINKIRSDIELNKVLLTNKENEVYNLSILENYFNEKNRLEEEKKSLDLEKLNLENLLDILNFWKIGFSSTGIPSLLIDESIPFLNETVGNYLDMVGGRYKASFDTISTTKSGEYRDKINVNVLDTQTKANNRKQLSGGQTRIIDIAILLSLCDLQNNVQNMKTNILLLDEIFDSLDDQNIGYVSNLLRTLVKDKSINIISHRHIDSIEADEVIRLF